MDVSEYTGFPEMMDGRVKTLHPKVHGGLLGVRGNEKHEKDRVDNGAEWIDLVVMNLYPFEMAVAKGGDFATCIENIDIGGPSMLRSSAKNHSYVTIITSPDQYTELIDEMKSNDGCTKLETRRRYAAAAFSLSAKYDATISNWFTQQIDQKPGAIVTRPYQYEMTMKYGCNPSQKPAAVYSMLGLGLPFKVLNGTPGYINLCDAANSWQLVQEVKKSLNTVCAASFKHVSPAGCGIAVPLSDTLKKAYEVGNREITDTAIAYIRARNADPMSSYGDFVAISDKVDVATANIIKIEVCDGIIAPAFEPEAFEILKNKKKGGFIILQGNPDFKMPEMEFRELHGMVLAQKHNDVIFTKEHLKNVVTSSKDFPEEAIKDLILASICIKYTQSNSVGYALNGQMIGVGAGQQSRVDCVKLAARKVTTWYLRQHPQVLGLKFKPSVKRQERVNARVRYIEGDLTDVERKQWETLFEEIPQPLTEESKKEFLKTISGVSLSSDAFFPFRDNIDHASKYGVKYIAQPGGSIADEEVTKACDEYGMVMAHTNLRLFHH